jgi:hypothetical protein
MKKAAVIGFMMICTSSSAMAYGYSYDYVDENANREVEIINAQEQADVMHELREGDYREAQEIIQEDEAIKNQIRREEARYDRARDMNRFNYGYYGYSRW